MPTPEYELTTEISVPEQSNIHYSKNIFTGDLGPGMTMAFKYKNAAVNVQHNSYQEFLYWDSYEHGTTPIEDLDNPEVGDDINIDPSSIDDSITVYGDVGSTYYWTDDFETVDTDDIVWSDEDNGFQSTGSVTVNTRVDPDRNNKVISREIRRFGDKSLHSQYQYYKTRTYSRTTRWAEEPSGTTTITKVDAEHATQAECTAPAEYVSTNGLVRYSSIQISGPTKRAYCSFEDDAYEWVEDDSEYVAYNATYAGKTDFGSNYSGTRYSYAAKRTQYTYTEQPKKYAYVRSDWTNNSNTGTGSSSTSVSKGDVVWENASSTLRRVATSVKYHEALYTIYSVTESYIDWDRTELGSETFSTKAEATQAAADYNLGGSRPGSNISADDDGTYATVSGMKVYYWYWWAYEVSGSRTKIAENVGESELGEYSYDDWDKTSDAYWSYSYQEQQKTAVYDWVDNGTAKTGLTSWTDPSNSLPSSASAGDTFTLKTVTSKSDLMLRTKYTMYHKNGYPQDIGEKFWDPGTNAVTTMPAKTITYQEDDFNHKVILKEEGRHAGDISYCYIGSYKTLSYPINTWSYSDDSTTSTHYGSPDELPYPAWPGDAPSLTSDDNSYTYCKDIDEHAMYKVPTDYQERSKYWLQEYVKYQATTGHEPTALETSRVSTITEYSSNFGKSWSTAPTPNASGYSTITTSSTSGEVPTLVFRQKLTAPSGYHYYTMDPSNVNEVMDNPVKWASIAEAGSIGPVANGADYDKDKQPLYRGPKDNIIREDSVKVIGLNGMPIKNESFSVGKDSSLVKYLSSPSFKVKISSSFTGAKKKGTYTLSVQYYNEESSTWSEAISQSYSLSTSTFEFLKTVSGSKTFYHNSPSDTSTGDVATANRWKITATASGSSGLTLEITSYDLSKWTEKGSSESQSKYQTYVKDKLVGYIQPSLIYSGDQESTFLSETDPHTLAAITEAAGATVITIENGRNVMPILS